MARLRKSDLDAATAQRRADEAEAHDHHRPRRRFRNAGCCEDYRPRASGLAADQAIGPRQLREADALQRKDFGVNIALISSAARTRRIRNRTAIYRVTIRRAATDQRIDQLRVGTRSDEDVVAAAQDAVGAELDAD